LIEKTRSAVTDGEGVYRIIDLRPGVYAVTFSLGGFNTIRRDGIDLPASFTATVSVEMQVGSLTETITVSGQAPLVDVTNAASQTVLSRDVIDAVPAARIATALTSLLPGAQTLNTSVVTVTRTWFDDDGDFIVDCDLTDILKNRECGQVNNLNFGKNNPHATTYDPKALSGWGVRNYNWETSAALQRELGRTTSATVAYYRRWYGNVTATHNLDVTPADFDPFCITPGADPRLPDGGGKKLCGYYNVSPAKFGHVDNYITLRSKNNFGLTTEVYTGVDLTLTTRFPGGAQISGGMSVGRTVTNSCSVVDSPQESLFCAVTPPFQPNIKAQGVYPLPWYGLQLSAALQNVPGAPITANYTATNEEVAPSLGRDLSSGASGTVVIPIIQPGTLFEHRQTQLDIRFTKRFKVQKTRILGSLDVFNILNRAGIDAVNTNYGLQWLRPTRIQGPRYVKISAQIDF
jgi:hypothetical protein